MDKPVYVRYFYWLFGSDWSAERKVGMPLKRITTADGFQEWWAVRDDGALVRWKLEGEDLIAVARLESTGVDTKYKNNEKWHTDANGRSTFWGLDDQNHAVLWEKGTDRKVWTFIIGTGWMESSGGPLEYIPLKKGFTRGDPGISFRTGRPVSDSIFVRLRNSLVLAGIAFVIVMPLALFLGMLAGLKEGGFRDRFLSIGGMMFSVTPEFATGIFLILIMSVWLKLVHGATVIGEQAPWERPDMLILPVFTLTLIEQG